MYIACWSMPRAADRACTNAAQVCIHAWQAICRNLYCNKHRNMLTHAPTQLKVGDLLHAVGTRPVYHERVPETTGVRAPTSISIARNIDITIYCR